MTALADLSRRLESIGVLLEHLANIERALPTVSRIRP
jgi:hypothetical protein